MIPNEELMRATIPEERFSEIPLEPRQASVILSTDQTGEDRKLLHAAREWQQRFQGKTYLFWH